MKSKAIFWIGIIGVFLFVASTIAAQLQLRTYYPLSQYISESFALGTPYGFYLRYFGLMPAGILFTIFAFSVPSLIDDYKPAKWGFYLFAIFYGLGTVLVAVFPCEYGCSRHLNTDSTLQLAHNLIGVFTYLITPFGLLLIGIKLKGLLIDGYLSTVSLFCGFAAIAFAYTFLSELDGDFAGLYQRMIEASMLIWMVYTAFLVRKVK